MAASELTSNVHIAYWSYPRKAAVLAAAFSLPGLEPLVAELVELASVLASEPATELAVELLERQLAWQRQAVAAQIGFGLKRSMVSTVSRGASSWKRAWNLRSKKQ